jgi:hydrogenase-4 component E
VTSSTYPQALDLAGGALLLTAALALWRRELAATVRVLAVQGFVLALLVALIGAHDRDGEAIGVAVFLAVLRGLVLPGVMRRLLGRDGGAPAGREARPLVNVAASLLAAAVLTLLAYAVARPLTDLDPGPATRALPVGLALVLIGFFALATRRQALSQVSAFLMLDNGITATAFLATGGLPLIVELGVSFDLLLVVLVLQLLGSRLRAVFGDTDLDDLRELHD